MPRWPGYKMSAETKARIAASHFCHGHASFPNGSAEVRTYRVWAALRKRCLNPLDAAFESYGGRGISFDPRWDVYENFLSDMGLCPVGLSLDREDNDGDYERANCRWATKQEQARNRRTSKLLTIEGETKTLAEWADTTGLNSSTIRMRIKYNGGVVDNTILAPIKGK